MSQIFFITLLIILALIRLPLSLLLVIIRAFVPFLKERLAFERMNFGSEASLPFSFEGKVADFCFEVSSEGELEQVRPLLEAVLVGNKKVELIYSSPSVESKCQLLYKNYPSQIRLLRLPLLSASPISFLYFRSVWQWVSAPVVIFCRYDFFPELLLLKLFKKKFILISGAFKKTSWYKLSSFKLFDVVVAATDIEKKNFQNLLDQNVKIYSCDFRVPRITERMQGAEALLLSKKALAPYFAKLKALPPSEKIILGSAWKSDLEILNHPELILAVKSGKLHLLIAPHKLDAVFCRELLLLCQQYFGEAQVAIVNEEHPYAGQPVVILQVGGILCELYGLFSLSYVGGGYERSIHSVLEPFVSNNVVVTGPKIHRSTEIDLALSVVPEEIHVLNRPDCFYTIIESTDFTHLDLEARENFRQQSEREMKAVIHELIG